MVCYSVLGCLVALIDVDALDGTTEATGDRLTGSVVGTTNCVVEDEDFGCAGSTQLAILAQLRLLQASDLRIFQQLLRLRVILILDLLLIDKQLLLTLMIVQLKPVFVKCII